MKTKISMIRLFLVFTSFFAAYSCDKFFDPDIETLLKEDQNFTDYLSSRSSVNGLYALLQDVMDSYIVNGELKADMLTVTELANEDLVRIYNMDFSPDNSYFDVLPLYTVVSNANDVIWHLEKLIDQGTSYDEELLNMYAESVIVRSWVYFYLIRNYKNVPYLSEEYTSTGSNGTLEEWLAENKSEITGVDEIISDVQEVIGSLDPGNFTQTGFFNIASGYAFLGEMFLWKDDYVNAVEALLNSAHSADNFRFILDNDLENAKWQNIFKGDETASDEIMTKINFNKGEKQQNDLLNLFSSISPTGAQLDPVGESLESLQGSYRYDGTFKSYTDVGKYTRSIDEPFTSDMPVILYRAADVHLMLAEAYNRLGNLTVALDLVNDGSDSLFTAFSKGVRGRIDLDPIQANGDNLEDLIIDLENKIIMERADELAFEGKRWYDLVRIARRRSNSNYIVDHMQKKYPGMEISEIEAFYGDPNNWFIELDY